MSRNDVSVVETGRTDVGSYYKSQPTALNLAHNAIPEDEVWTSSPVMCADELGGDADKADGGLVLEIDMEEFKPLVPPDGGWGWVIALGSFLCLFLVDGVCFSYGIFLSELQTTFGASKTKMALAGSLLSGCYFMVGPLASGLMNRFGARKLVVVGSLVSSAAIFAGSFATDVDVFIVVFGVIGGCGFGLLYLPASTIVTSWFVKKRATVTGLVTAGSGIGVTCYSLLIPYLINAYTWRGCILLLSALNLNNLLAAALFRPLWKNQPVDKKGPDTIKVQSRSRKVSRSSLFGMSQSKINIKQLARQVLEAEAERMQANEDAVAHSTTGLNDSVYRVIPKREFSRKSNTSWDDIVITHGNQLVPVPEGTTLAPTSTERLPMLSLEVVNHIVEEVMNRSTVVSTTSLAGPTRLVRRKTSALANGSQRWFSSTTSQLGQMSVKPTDTATVYLKPDNAGSTSFFASAISLRAGAESAVGPSDEAAVRDAIVKELRKEVARPVHKKDLFLSGSVMQLNEYVASPNVDSYLRNVTTPAEELQAKSPFRAMLRNLLNVSILRSPTFQLLNASSVLTMIGFIVPFQFLKDSAQNDGFGESESANLLAYLGMMNTISRIISGFLSDRPWADVLVLNNISLILSGLLTAFVPLFNTYAGLLFYACSFGFVVATFIAVRTVLIVKLLGLDRLTNAYGFLLLFQGVALVASPPLFGAMYDALHSYRYIFITGGISILLSGVLCLPLKCLVRWEQRKEAQTNDACVDPTDVGDSSSPVGPVRIVRRLRDWFRRWKSPEPKIRRAI